MHRTTGHGRPALLLARLAVLAAAALCLAPATAAAAIPFDLTTVPKLRVLGADGAGSVHAVAGRCDLDDDGTPDLIVGQQDLNPDALPIAPGGATIVFGAAGDLADRVVLRGDPGKGTEASATGASVACGGDVNGDGVDDALIGATGWSPVGSPNGRHGAVFVVFGGNGIRALPSIDLANLGARGFRIEGVSYSATVGVRLGASIAGLGDLDGDGKDEIGLGIPAWRTGLSPAPTGIGAAMVVRGRSATTSVDLADPASTMFRLTGTTASDALGPLAALDDVDGDDVPDFAVGARGFDHDPDGGGAEPARTNGGAVLVVSGADAQGAHTVAPGALPAPVLRAIYGDVAGRAAGTSVAAAGDVNADGDPDLLVGSAPVSTASDAYADVVFGGPTTPVDLGAARSGFRIRNPANEDLQPAIGAFAGVGDVSGDGRDDVLVGSSGQKRVALVYGKSDFQPISLLALNASRGAQWVSDTFPIIGGALAGTGDMNGDGFADLAIGGSGLTSTSDTNGFVDVLTLPDPATGGGTPVEEVDTIVDWGVRANLRNYVYGSSGAPGYVPGVSPPPIVADDGALCTPNPDVAVGGCDPARRSGLSWPVGFQWTPTGASLDVAGDTAVVATRGRVVLSYPAHCFTITLRDPRWTLAGSQASVSVRITQDIVEDCSVAGAPGAVSGADSDARVTLGTFPISERIVRAKTVTWKTEPGALGEEGNKVLALLYVGAELDPATITVSRTIGALPSLEGELDDDGRGGDGPGPTVEKVVERVVPGPAAPAVTQRVSSKGLTATVRGAKTGKRRVKVTLSRALGLNPLKAYRVWLTKGGNRVATGSLEGTELVLTVAPRRTVTGKGASRRVRTTYPRLKGTYTLRPATAGSKLPTVLVKLS